MTPVFDFPWLGCSVLFFEAVRHLDLFRRAEFQQIHFLRVLCRMRFWRYWNLMLRDCWRCRLIQLLQGSKTGSCTPANAAASLSAPSHINLFLSCCVCYRRHFLLIFELAACCSSNLSIVMRISSDTLSIPCASSISCLSTLPAAL